MLNFLLDKAPLIGLLFFISVFLIVIVKTFSKSRKEFYQEQAQIPLKEQR